MDGSTIGAVSESLGRAGIGEWLLKGVGPGVALGWLLKALIDWLIRRQERIDTERAERRSQSYGEIWTLSGAFNLFGPETRPNLDRLTREMSDWYFTHGQMLTPSAREHYFIIQEGLMFCSLRSLYPERPDGALLYANIGTGTVHVLKSRRNALLKRWEEAYGPEKSKPPDDRARERWRADRGRCYALQEMRTVLDRWKRAATGEEAPKEDAAEPDASDGPERAETAEEKPAGDGAEPSTAEVAWIVLQHLFSRFRTRLTDEMKSRQSWLW